MHDRVNSSCNCAKPLKESRPLHRTKVLLWMSRVSTYGRRVLAGVSRFCREREVEWRLYGEPSEVAHPTGPLEGFRPHGAIVNRGHIKPEQAEWLADVPFPVVNVSPTPIAGNVLVVPDDLAVGRLGAEHFLERSFTRFAFVRIGYDVKGLRREEGYRRCLREAGYQVDEFHLEWGFEPRSWAEDIAGCGRWLERLARPVACFCSNDMAAGRVIEACRAHKLRVPGEVGVLGVNDNPLICEFTSPPLSSVGLDADRLGYQAAVTLHAMLAGQDVPPVRRLAPRSVVVRASTDIMMVDDPVVLQAVAHIRDNIATCRTVDDLLEALPVSRRDLERRFRRTMHCGPWEEIRRLQLRRARSLLGETDLTLDEIGRLCGLGNAKRLGEVFRKQLSTSPTRYRRSVRGTA
jgi:LacI family transcriptional regulator